MSAGTVSYLQPGSGTVTAQFQGMVYGQYCAPISITQRPSGRVQVGCGDQRDTIIAEYPQYGVAFTPTCADFTQTAHSAHFSFARLNSGDYTWAIIRNSLLTGLECVRTGNGNVALTINSGYRNPAHNAAVRR